MESNFQSEMIGESRQYMVPSKHTWDNKSSNQSSRVPEIKYYSFTWHHRVPVLSLPAEAAQQNTVTLS